jgi:hypothetical protein
MKGKKGGTVLIIFIIAVIIIIVAIVGYFLIGLDKSSPNTTTSPINFEELAEICRQASLDENKEAYLQFHDLKLESGVVIRANCNCGGVHSNFPQGIKGYLKSDLGRGYWKGRISVDDTPPDVKECNRLIDEFTSDGKTDCTKIPRINGLFCSKNIKDNNVLDGDNAFSEDNPFYSLYLTGDVKQVTCS